LPQLFDPKNYKTIFAHLHKIEVGDEIHVNVDNADFVYKIYEKIITTPDDTSIFTQNYDSSYITLVTCTPPGTTWKRLIIKAKIENLEK
jgi:sortase A